MPEKLSTLSSDPALGMLDDLETYASADPRDLGSTHLSQLRTLFEGPDLGLFLFCRVIFGYKDLTTALHLPICRFLSRWGETVLTGGRVVTHPPGEDEEMAGIDESHRRLMVIIPREHFKTSVCTRANTLWTIARDPTHDATIGIFNEKEDNAKAWVGAIAELVEGSLLFQKLWPELLPPGVSFADKDKGVAIPRRWKWGESGVKFVRDTSGVPELSIEPHGIGGAATGKHFTHVMLDDIIGKSAAESVSIMEDAKVWMDSHRSLERPAEAGCELIACTTWAYNDVYAYAAKKWGDYRIYRRSILEDEQGFPDVVNGKAIMPSKISTAKAKQMLKVDDYNFWKQYMCIPKSGRHVDFNEEWFRFGKIIESGQEPIFRIDDEHYDPSILNLDCDEESAPQFIPLSRMDKVVILDPAPTKPTDMRKEPGARNGIIVAGQDPWGRRFQLDECPLREDPIGVFHQLVKMCKEWQTRRVAIEDVNFSYIYQPFMDRLMTTEYPDMHIDFVGCYTEGREKHSRIKDQIPGMKSGFMYFNRPCTKYTLQELLEYPNGETLDLIDALAYIEQVTSRPDAPGEAWMTAYQNSRHDDRGISGYGF